MWRACSVLVVLLPLLAACAPVPVTIAQNMLAATPTPTPDATPPPSGTPPIGVPPVVGTPRRVTPPSAPTVGAAATATHPYSPRDAIVRALFAARTSWTNSLR